MLTMALRRVLTPALLVAALSMTMAASSTVPAAAEEEKVLNVFNWSDYVAPDTIENFTKEPASRSITTFTIPMTILETKLTGSASPATTSCFHRPAISSPAESKAGSTASSISPRSRTPGRRSPRCSGRLATVDPGNAYALALHDGRHRRRLHQNARSTSCCRTRRSAASPMLFDPKTVKALQSCGVTVLDAPEEVLPGRALLHGQEPGERDHRRPRSGRQDGQGGARRPTATFTRRITSTISPGGDIPWRRAMPATCSRRASARRRPRTASSIGIFLPKEGTAFNIDVMAIPKDAPHPDNAHKFINYIPTPKVVADITAAVGYANAVQRPRSNSFRPRSGSDPVVFPPDDAKLYTPSLVTPAYERSAQPAVDEHQSREVMDRPTDGRRLSSGSRALRQKLRRRAARWRAYRSTSRAAISSAWSALPAPARRHCCG